MLVSISLIILYFMLANFFWVTLLHASLAGTRFYHEQALTSITFVPPLLLLWTYLIVFRIADSALYLSPFIDVSFEARDEQAEETLARVVASTKVHRRTNS